MTSTPLHPHPSASTDHDTCHDEVRDHAQPGGDAGPGWRLRRIAYEPPVTAAGSLPAPVVAVAVPADLPEHVGVQVEMERWMRLLVEVLSGRRPARQLSGVVARPVVRYLHVSTERLSVPRVGAGVGAGWPAQVITVRVCQPHERAAEVAGVCLLGGRVRAVAVRFERHGSGAWFCEALRVG
jgi:hypothetical protein